MGGRRCEYGAKADAPAMKLKPRSVRAPRPRKRPTAFSRGDGVMVLNADGRTVCGMLCTGTWDTQGRHPLGELAGEALDAIAQLDFLQGVGRCCRKGQRQAEEKGPAAASRLRILGHYGWLPVERGGGAPWPTPAPASGGGGWRSEVLGGNAAAADNTRRQTCWQRRFCCCW